MKIKKLKKRSIAILWFGKEGKSSLHFLLAIGTKKIGIFDDKEESMYEFSKFLVDSRKSFDFQMIKDDWCYRGKVKYLVWKKIVKLRFCFGSYTSDDLKKFEAIIKAPGVSPYQDRFSEIKDKFTSQTQIFYNNYWGKIIGITGTKWKSTISSLTYKALKKAKFKVKLVGNIGTPVLDEIDIIKQKKYDYIVYEMSSYMLDHFTPKNFISVLNNVYTCHIDWHKTFDNYQEAKTNILRHSKHKLVNNVFSHLAGKEKFDTFGSSWDYFYKDHHFYIGDTKVASAKHSRLKGEHNMENISAVVGILHKVMKNKKKVGKLIEHTLESFEPLEHRLEKVWTYKGITFINDAIAVTPEATIAAIKTYTWDVETIFLWGKEVGYDFSHLEKLIEQSGIKNIVLFPDAHIFHSVSPKLKENKPTQYKLGNKLVTFMKTKSMQSAVSFSYKHTSQSKVVLLSCAAQSFSLWKNFEMKWAEFKKYVREGGKSN